MDRRPGGQRLDASSPCASDKLLRSTSRPDKLPARSFDANSTPYQVRVAKNGPLYVSSGRGAGGRGRSVDDEGDADDHRPTPKRSLVSGDRLFVTCGNDDVVDIFDRYTGTSEERIAFGMARRQRLDHALAISPDGARDCTSRGGVLLIAVRQNAQRSRSKQDGEDRSVAPQDIPHRRTIEQDLFRRCPALAPEAMTKTNTGLKYKPQMVERPFQAPRAVRNPSSRLRWHPIKHVLYIIKENRTYASCSATLRDGKQYGNGDRG